MAVDGGLFGLHSFGREYLGNTKVRSWHGQRGPCFQPSHFRAIYRIYFVDCSRVSSINSLLWVWRNET